MSQIQKRKEIRADINLSLAIREICVREDRVIRLDKILLAKVVNLSASGVLLHSALSLPLDLGLFLNLPLGDDIVPCIADIIRKEIREDGHYYGCRLHVISDCDISKIRKFAFSKQFEKIKYRSANQA